MKTIRLQKYLADCGVASRRGVEDLIVEGRVTVNGVGGLELGVKIDPGKDEIEVDGKKISQPEKKIYLKLNKPAGYVSTCKSQKGEETILDLVSDLPYRLYPVGRLDKDSEGLMILTNDGDLANELTHPRYEHEKEYEVNVQFPMTNDQLRKLKTGVITEEGKTLPARVYPCGDRYFRIVLKEGKKRQIRLMVEAVGNRVVRLQRIRIANIKLGNLPLGQYELLTSKAIKSLL
ncbi:MAG: pseudouridine synthase [bacterium]